jgi:hypothetical protein
VEELEDRVADSWERTELDKESCGKIFRAMKARTTKTSLKFFRRVGQKG